MKNHTKLLPFLVLAVLPFFAGCAAFRTADISIGLDKKSLTYEAAKKAIEGGADVKSGWTGEPFIQQAAEQRRKDLVVLFVENGASCFEAPGGYKNKPFSLFVYVVNEWNDEELLQLCFDHPDKLKEPMRSQIYKAATDMKEQLLRSAKGERWIYDSRRGRDQYYGKNSDDSFRRSLLAKVYSSKILGDSKSEEFNPEKIELELKEIQREIATKALLAFLKNSNYGKRDKSIEELISSGADINAIDEEGHSVLFLAKKKQIKGDLKGDSIKSLKDAGAKMSPAEAQQILSNVYSGYGFAGVKFDDELRDYISSGGDVSVTIDGQSLIYWVHKKYDSENIERADELIALLEKNGAKPLISEKYALESFAQKRVDEHKKQIASVLEHILSGSNRIVDVDKELSAITQKDFLDAKDKDGNSIYCGAIKICMGQVSAFIANPRSQLPVNLQGGGWSEEFEREVSKLSNELCYMLLGKVDTLVQQLKAKGAKFTQKDTNTITDAKTAAYIALLCAGRWNEIATLAKNGFDLKREESFARLGGGNAFHALNMNSSLGICMGLEGGYANGNVDESIIAALKKAGVDINKKNDKGYSPLASAITMGNVEVIKALLKYGANPKGTVPIKGALGDAGEKSLLDFAIDEYNDVLKKAERDRGGRKMIERYKAIVSIMSDATGEKVKTVGDF